MYECSLQHYSQQTKDGNCPHVLVSISKTRMMVAKHCEPGAGWEEKRETGDREERGGERTKPLGEARAAYTASDKGVVLA